MTAGELAGFDRFAESDHGILVGNRVEDFDPYYRWLGIRDQQRPPNFYRLLGLELFEDDLGTSHSR